ncbi:MAG: galactofuranosyltransferase [Prevotella sp.]|uniref:galactofuranosyltransferase n=1 Tax=Prevotella sp. TaxID=59823 RepID=UPI002A2F5872|nr:galactofuranosyltransferase [Prevotella sp.]MDD7318388.1 galactofuranosyltransferase [Prevotellaceae bacterium]MDY4020261.1 galactofuranosyltransferase [Prevotella sp.]
MMKERRLCYISRNYKGRHSAGNKAKGDYEDIVARAGAHNLGLRRTYCREKLLAFLIDLAGIVVYTFSVRKGDVVFLQYPIKKYFSFICRTARWRGASTVAFIHDLGSFRRKRLTVEQELRRLSNADCIIAANDVMAEWLKEKGLERPCTGLGLHDYLSKSDSKGKPYSFPPGKIVYAGSIAERKNMFLVRLSEAIKRCEIHVYGSNHIAELKPSGNLILHNPVEPDEFIATATGDFGLVWDGDSLTGCTGDFGEYLRVNSPHKASFYLRAGLPLIVWSRSAIAHIVEREGIGIAVDRIDDIEDVLGRLTESDVRQMRDNVERVSRDLAGGMSMRRAIEKVMAWA